MCSGTVRVDVRQLLAVANSGANSVTLYVNGQNVPLATIQNGVTSPAGAGLRCRRRPLRRESAGKRDANTRRPTAQPADRRSAVGVNHPQALALDARGNLFVANGNGSNTVTMYSPPYGGAPAATITTGVDDPVSLAFDSGSNLFVVNRRVAIRSPSTRRRIRGTPTTISNGLNAPNSLALDSRGNLFVANLNRTPNSVVEYYAAVYERERAGRRRSPTA